MERKLADVVRTDVLGVPVDVVKSQDLPSVIAALLAEPGRNQIVFLRTWDLMRARRSRAVRLMLRNAALVIPVSRGIQRGARFLLRRVPARYHPFDFVIRMLNVVEEKRASLYLLGLKRKDVVLVENNIRRTFPGIALVGRYNGYYPSSVEPDIIMAIKKAAPSVLLAGPGVPRRDRWINDRKSQLHPGIYLWSAEVLEILADRRQRPPRKSFERGTDALADAIRRPWRILRLFVYAWYGLLLLVHRVLKK